MVTILLAVEGQNSKPEDIAKAKQIDKIYNDAAITRTKALCAKYGLEVPPNLG